ncbi:chemotaxis protein [Marinobacter sp. EhC06]|uniref:methyl-accepting chemotaxis protein n=1 Tax=Marinobacter TaxID=2742 RepID=UPI0007D8D5C9|nr:MULTISPECIES: methyl-accepting chemotaxis protein [unclassified Marinobacter]OAN95275.1 chemotaxis protein [Marinobacter sp. EhC06]OAN96000.1 chemotaxis protein [Marinobacter sp. EhN04]
MTVKAPSLSWRQKFLALMILTPIGLAFIGGAVFWGLERVSQSYESIYKVMRYGNEVGNLVTELNDIEKKISSLTTENINATRTDLNQLIAEATQIKEQGREVGDAGTLNYADQIQEEIRRYVELRKQWLKQIQTLGLSENEGIRHEVEKVLVKLQNLSMTATDEAVKDIAQTKQGYVDYRNSDFADSANEAVAELEQLVEEYGWQNNVIGETAHNYRQIFDRADALLRSAGATKTNGDRIGNTIRDLVAAQQDSLQSGLIAQSIARAEAAGTSAEFVSLGAIAFCGPLLILALFLISRALVNRLYEVVDLLSQVSDGDLTQKLALGTNARDEFNTLARATNQMVDNIGKLMNESIAGTENLLEVHGELDKTMSRLVKNSETVESQTIQAAAGSQQIAVTLNDVAERTNQVGVSTQSANDAAKTGAQVVHASVESMRRLSTLIQSTHGHVKQLTKASANVTGIIDVINGLAEQTNLLALNAAIEAARAGDAGRGFSVVADEVRTLAQKTVAATTNITSIIEDLNSQTISMDALATDGLSIAQEGEKSASLIATTMGNITDSIENLNSEMDQVVVAVEEISATSEEIAQKMETIRGQSSETQAIGKDLGRLNERLSHQAGLIAESTRRFRIDENRPDC